MLQMIRLDIVRFGLSGSQNILTLVPVEELKVNWLYFRNDGLEMKIKIKVS